MDKVEEFAAAVERFLALPVEEQRRLIEEAGKKAAEISERFERSLRVDPADLARPMTI